MPILMKWRQKTRSLVSGSLMAILLFQQRRECLSSQPPGPVLANYGLENLRFVEPVGIGDTIQVKITVKKKVLKARRPDEDRATGVVVWDVEVYNQNEDVVALYDIMTLVERKEG